MPATAGRVRMPANNRVHSSAALQTHGIWQSAIGYDPYAPNKEESKGTSQQQPTEADAENAYANFQGLLALARITGSNADVARGACKKCGRVGHLSFQCRNFLSIKDDIKERDTDAIQSAVLSGLDKVKGNGKTLAESEDESEEEEDDSESSDSEVDSEMERLIAGRYGKKTRSKGKSFRKKKKKKVSSDEDDSDSDSGDRKKRGRSKKRRSRKRAGGDSEDEDEDRKKRRREKSRKRDIESSDEDSRERRHKRKSRKEKRRRRRSHRHSNDSDLDTSEDYVRWHKRKSRKEFKSDSDDSKVRRGDSKRHEKKSDRRHCEEDK